MVKTIKMSMIAASLMATSAMAIDLKEIDFKVGGQAKIYYQTAGDNGDAKLFDQPSSRANIGFQLDATSDLGNGFGFGSQVNYLGTAGIEKNLVANTLQDAGNKVDSNSIGDDIYISQLYLTKQIKNTTIKLGRQELPQSLSPLAYTEDWNVFTNTFNAAVVINTDIPNTTIVGAYVSTANYNDYGSDMANYGHLSVSTGGDTNGDGIVNHEDDLAAEGASYMLTIQNKSCEHATTTLSAYSLEKIAGAVDAKVLWGDVAIGNSKLPYGLNFGVQGGAILVDSGLDDTKAFGLKANVKPMDKLDLTIAYSSVNDGLAGMKNVGGITTPFYTQIILNESGSQLDSDTVMVKGSYDLGEYGNVMAAASMSSSGNLAPTKDLNEFDLVYSIKASGAEVQVAYVNQSWDAPAGSVDSQDVIRIAANYRF